MLSFQDGMVLVPVGHSVCSLECGEHKCTAPCEGKIVGHCKSAPFTLDGVEARLDVLDQALHAILDEIRECQRRKQTLTKCLGGCVTFEIHDLEDTEMLSEETASCGELDFDSEATDDESWDDDDTSGFRDAGFADSSPIVSSPEGVDWEHGLDDVGIARCSRCGARTPMESACMDGHEELCSSRPGRLPLLTISDEVSCEETSRNVLLDFFCQGASFLRSFATPQLDLEHHAISH